MRARTSAASAGSTLGVTKKTNLISRVFYDNEKERPIINGKLSVSGKMSMSKKSDIL
jgi:hypothetical protein